MARAGITAVKTFFPPRVVTNEDLSKIMDTNDEWIRTRTGISTRHWVEEGVGASDLAVPAIQKILEEKEISAEEIDTILVATVTPDTMFPSTACRIQAGIGATNAWGYDISAACSGFLYALVTGCKMVEAGSSKKCLVVGVDVMSSIINKEDRTTTVLFGDGAGVVLLEPVEEGGFVDGIMRMDGNGGDFLYMPAGGSLRPASCETVENKEHFVHQKGREVYKRAVSEMANVSVEILEKNNLPLESVSLFIPHQANLRIIDAAAKRLKLKPEQVMLNIDRRANTTAATLPSCLEDAVIENRLKKGDLVLFATFGAGFTWGSALLEWSL